MALEKFAQIKTAISQAQAILIALPELALPDAICGALALQTYLQAQGKTVTIIAANYMVPAKLKFLPGINNLQSTIGPLQKCLISIDAQQAPISDVRYQESAERLQIQLTPATGKIKREHITINEQADIYDLIITVGASDKASLGALYKNHHDFLERVPVLNIDQRADNENFGQINWVDLNASSICEMLYQNFFVNSAAALDQTSATLLLTGMMAQTHAFRSLNLKAQTLASVGQLMAAGADHQTIVTNLYRTKTIGQLRLWGHVFNNLQQNKELGLVYSLIPASVFTTTQTARYDLQDLHDEVLAHTPEAKIILLFIESENNPQDLQVQISCRPPYNAKDLLKNLQAQGGERRAYAILPNTNLHVGAELVIKSLQTRLQVDN